MLLESFQGNDLQSLLVSGGNDHRAAHSLVNGILPCLCADAPSVAGGQPGETVLRHWCDQVIPLGACELQELLGNQAANGVQTMVIAVCVAASIPIPASERFSRSGIQNAPENVEGR